MENLPLVLTIQQFDELIPLLSVGLVDWKVSDDLLIELGLLVVSQVDAELQGELERRLRFEFIIANKAP